MVQPNEDVIIMIRQLQIIKQIFKFFGKKTKVSSSENFRKRPKKFQGESNKQL